MNAKNLFLMLTCMLTTLICIAKPVKPTKTVAAKQSPNYAGPTPTNYSFMTDDFYEKEIIRVKKEAASRKMANTDRVDYATAFSDDFKNLSSEIMGGSVWKDNKETSEVLKGIRQQENNPLDSQLAVIVDKYNQDANYKNLSVQSKWVAAQLAALKPWRGFLTRARPLIEKSGAPFVHTFLISWLRSVNAGINAFVPTPQWKAGFDYVVKPFVGMPADIETERQLYNFVQEELLPALYVLSGRLNHLVYTYTDEGTPNERRVQNNEFKPFYFDNKLVYSTSKIVDEQDRYVILDRAELLSALSGVNLTISALQGSLAYDWTELLPTIHSIGAVYGFNTYIPFINHDKMTAKFRINKIKDSTGLFKLIPAQPGLPEGGSTWTKVSYTWFKEGVRNGRLAWHSLKASKNENRDRYPIMDPRSLTPFARIIDTSFENIEALIKGEGVKSSLVDGEEIQVNFKLLFDNPPADLKSFLAVDFEGGESFNRDPLTKRKYRNYMMGNPKSWNAATYQKYFPGITQENIPKAARILSQTWGSNIIGAALYPVLF